MGSAAGAEMPSRLRKRLACSVSSCSAARMSFLFFASTETDESSAMRAAVTVAVAIPKSPEESSASADLVKKLFCYHASACEVVSRSDGAQE